VGELAFDKGEFNDMAISQKGCRVSDPEPPRRRGRGRHQCPVRAWRHLFHGARRRSVDLIEAHKWFNLAALGGCTRGQACRAEISAEMTAREIAEAQKAARAWLALTGRLGTRAAA
jgi:hypothetical protein